MVLQKLKGIPVIKSDYRDNSSDNLNLTIIIPSDNSDNSDNLIFCSDICQEIQEILNIYIANSRK